MKRERRSCAIDFTNDPGLTEQNFKESCNVNNIIKKFKKTGALTHLNKREAQYGDVSGADFQTALEVVASAQNSFDLLPSKIRKKFENNPALFLDFVNDPNNEEALVDMGLATRKEIEGLVRPKEEIENESNGTGTPVAPANSGEAA